MASRSATSLLDPAIAGRAALSALRKLDPRTLARNPVIFVTEVVSLGVSLLFARDLVTANGEALFSGQIAAWLWFTVLFANFAEAVAEGRGKAQADAMRRTRSDTRAKRLVDHRHPGAAFEEVNALDLKAGDVVLVEPGDLIPADGEVIDGIASVNESAITGESAPVIRESGGDRSAVTGGTMVLSDRIKVRVTAAAGSTFLDRMIALVEGAERQKTPNELALTILLSGLTIIFLIVCVTLWPIARYSGATLSVTVLVALLVCLIPTTIGGLLSAIGIAGMDRLIRFNVVATSGRAVEAAGDVDTLLLDKTGTITFGNRMPSEFIPVGGVPEQVLAEAVLLASLADETPEGRSIVALAKSRYGLAETDLVAAKATIVPFTAQTRMSGIDLDGRSLRKGAVDSVLASVGLGEGGGPADFRAAVDRIARTGGTPLAVAEDRRLLGVVHLKDTVKPDIKERFAALRAMGIKTVMVTGDNPVTAAAIASEAGVDDFLAKATPRGQARLYPQGTGGRAAHRHVRRRHQRCPRPRPGRCRGRHADRHAGGARGRQHGRSRQRPHETHRGRRHRQAASDDARLADHLLDRQRRREIFRDHPRLVPGHLSGARRAQRDGAVLAAVGDPVGGDFQRADHHRPHSPGAEGRPLPAGRRGGAAAAQPHALRARRHRRPLHRHQDHRSCRLAPPSGVIPMAHLRPAIVMIVLFTLLTGIAYPLAIAGIAQVAFPAPAGGSLVVRDGKVIGSALIGQSFATDRYFWSRPSATSAPDPKDPSKTIDAPYNAANSSGSNLGPTSQKLVDRVKASVAALGGGPEKPRAGRRRDDLCLGPRPGHLGGLCVHCRSPASPPPASWTRSRSRRSSRIIRWERKSSATAASTCLP